MATIPDPKNLFSVSGKAALVTGATGALGRVATLALVKAGAKAVVTASNQAALDKLVAEVKAAGGEAVAVARRAEGEADAQAMVDAAVKSFGGLDIVFAS